ncbi:hypothetical protein A2U01_0102908, partial [Trifolium medium]|nr:hypothetical protein [Trifolium medium]
MATVSAGDTPSRLATSGPDLGLSL